MLVRNRTELSSAVVAAPFIVGVARSGTTLLRIMLDAHPQLAIPPETHFIPEAAAAARGSAENSRKEFIDCVLGSRFWDDFQLDAETLRRQVQLLDPFHVGAALRVFYQLYAERFGKRRWGDKTPTYLTQMRLIAELLPEACFIHVIRDGRDVLLSVKGLWFGPASVSESAGTWVNRIQSARAEAVDLPNYMEIRYEDLVLDSEKMLRAICAFLDLPWEPRILDYHRGAEERLAEIARDVQKGGKLVATAKQRTSIHALTSKQPDATRIGRWKEEMSAADRKEFERIAQPLLAELGYID
ncbi:MAG: hypothetical protein QOH39_2971 [Verrucomicrobiota bacterium]